MTTPPSNANDVVIGSDSRLLMLPREVCDQIYDHVFVTAADTEHEIDLLAAAGPDKALLLVSRQLHSETRAIQRTSYQRYWRTGNFVLNLWNETFCGQTIDQLSTLRDEDLNALTRLTCVSRCYSTTVCCWTETLCGNIWRCRVYSSILMLRPYSGYYEVVEPDIVRRSLRMPEQRDAFAAGPQLVMEPMKRQIAVVCTKQWACSDGARRW